MQVACVYKTLSVMMESPANDSVYLWMPEQALREVITSHSESWLKIMAQPDL